MEREILKPPAPFSLTHTYTHVIVIGQVSKSVVVVYTYNSSTKEDEAGRLSDQGQSGLHGNTKKVTDHLWYSPYAQQYAQYVLYTISSSQQPWAHSTDEMLCCSGTWIRSLAQKEWTLVSTEMAPGFPESLAIPKAQLRRKHDFPDRARWGVQGNNVLLEDLLFRPV